MAIITSGEVEQARGNPRSHHFKVLRESGIVASRRDGNELINLLRKGDLKARFPGLLKSIVAAGKQV